MDNVTLILKPKQEQAIELMLDHIYTMLYGSSRSGKSFAIIALIFIRALKKKSRHAILRHRFSHAKRSIVFDTLPKVAELMGIEYTMNKSDWFLTLPNGSEIWVGGLDDASRVDAILGNEYSTIFLNEVSQISYDSFTTVLTRLAERSGLKNRLFCDQNPPSKAHWTYKLFVQKINPDTKSPIKNPENYSYLKMVAEDNRGNIAEEYFDILEGLTGTKRKRFFIGDFANEDLSALFTERNLAENRIDFVPNDLVEVIVAVDPATTAKITSDETGIVVVGKDSRGRGYVLDDVSGIYTPRNWGKKAVAMYRKWDAKYVVAESNQGGLMVSHTINTVDMSVPVKLVHATKSKIIRAEPVSALYANGRISHVGSYVDLEDEMISYTGALGDVSPNRLDALVWGITYLYPVEVSHEMEFSWD